MNIDLNEKELEMVVTALKDWGNYEPNMEVFGKYYPNDVNNLLKKFL